MRIENDRTNPLINAYTQNAQPRPDAARPRSASPQDQVDISDEARMLAQMKETLLADVDEPGRAERIAKLAIEVRNGTYQVSPRLVADAVLNDMGLAGEDGDA